MNSFQACLHHLFKAQAGKNTETLAVVSHDVQTTYSDLDRDTDSLGEYLQHYGVDTDDRVGVFMETCSEYIVACIGALKAGAAFMPLALNSPDNLLKSILAEATPRVIITKQKYISRLDRDPSTHVLTMDGGQSWRGVNSGSLQATISDRYLAFVPYTSGTTGDPKGNADPRRRVVILLRSIQV